MKRHQTIFMAGGKSAGRFAGQIMAGPTARARLARVGGLLLATAVAAQASAGFGTQGGEYPIAGTQPGEQVYPQASVQAAGGYLVWQDNVTDGSGYGISARKLDGSFSGSFSAFRVNALGDDEQERPGVSLLKDGGAVFAWQGGKPGYQHIYARMLSGAGTFADGDVMVNSSTNTFQVEPTVTTLANGNAVVAWSSFNQVSSNSLRDVYFQILTPAGGRFGVENLANQFTTFNQRSAALAPLSDGRFVLIWISEQQRFENSVDVYGRIYSATGTPAGAEFLVNSGTNVCANPSVAPSADGGFAVAWMEHDVITTSNSWDVLARPFTANALGGVARTVNTRLYGDQVGPKIAAAGMNYLVTWTSLGQDGSREGVYGQFLNADGSLLQGEMRANTTVASQQIQPTVASDGATRFLVVWTSFVGGAGVFDLMAQRYATTDQPLPAPGAPVVTVLSPNSLSVTWPLVAGLSVSNYEVYADGAATPAGIVTESYWSVSNLAPASQHSYRLAYVLTDGRRSPLSAATTNTTYGAGATWGGIPQEWMVPHFGADILKWPLPTLDSDGDGASNLAEFLAGTDPNDAASVLRVRLAETPQGMFLNWNTQEGLVYQVQSAPTSEGPWTNLGGLRFAADTVDSIYVGGGSAGYYRIVRLR